MKNKNPENQQMSNNTTTAGPVWSNYAPFFARHEFDSPDQPGSGDLMQPAFLDRLLTARRFARVPFRITSGFRTRAHNQQVGGTSNSAHLRGWAADIGCSNGRQRHIIVKALMMAGFNRIGIARGFVHADCDPSLPANNIWLY